MSMVTLTPFGTLGQESGVIQLLANYLRKTVSDLVQLRCNGVFSLCDRDSETGWVRGISTCFQCMADQQRLADWSGAAVRDLSTYISAQEVEETKRWMLTLESEELLSACYAGAVVSKLCEGSFRNRFGTEVPDLQNKNHDQVLRRLLLASVRMYLASHKFLKAQAPSICLVAGGIDFITKTFCQVARERSVPVAIFQWDWSARQVQLLHPRNGKVLKSDLYFERITALRPDPSTWAPELLVLLKSMLEFLELEVNQTSMQF